jgi:hypothetical protein
MFGEKKEQNLAANIAKMHGRGTPARMVTPEPLAGDTPKMPIVKKSTTVTPTSTQRVTDQLVDGERKGPQTKRFRWTLVMLTKSFVSVWS